MGVGDALCDRLRKVDTHEGWMWPVEFEDAGALMYSAPGMEGYFRQGRSRGRIVCASHGNERLREGEFVGSN